MTSDLFSLDKIEAELKTSREEVRRLKKLISTEVRSLKNDLTDVKRGLDELEQESK